MLQVKRINPGLKPRCVITGPVQEGEKVGRTIGFPTTNIAMNEATPLPFGIYVSFARINGGRRRGGVSYLGRRPTVNGTSLLLETHIFDFDQDIYGAILTIELFEQLRGDARFDGLASLKLQIEKDCMDARQRLRALLEQSPASRARRIEKRGSPPDPRFAATRRASSHQGAASTPPSTARV